MVLGAQFEASQNMKETSINCPEIAKVNTSLIDDCRGVLKAWPILMKWNQTVAA